MNDTIASGFDKSPVSESTPTPLISVLIATYNRSRSLCRSIDSVLSQPGDYFEVVIGNDASPDNTHEAVQPYLADPRVRYYRNEVNLGMQKNYLKILRAARGEFILILTDDDWMIKGGLDRIVHVIRTYPQAGFILSDLPTVDDRTGKVVSIHRAYETDRLVYPSARTMAEIVGHAWVLSRQVLKRELVDWETWEIYKENIFFPMILSGRILLKAPYYYIADQVVMHTWFNEVFWHKFGRDQVEIDFNLAADRHKVISTILHDYERTPDIRQVINRWEIQTLKLYLGAEQHGFYELIRSVGLIQAMARLRSGFHLTLRGYVTVGIFFIQLPVHRLWFSLKSLLRRFAPGLLSRLRPLNSRIKGQIG